MLFRSFKEAAFWSSIWVACGLAVGGVIWYFSGADYGLQYLSGYVIEKSLAVDNVFIWGLLFSALAVPTRFQHRVLFFGVVGALVMRGVMILMGAALIKQASWTLYIFGAFLIYTAIKMYRQRGEEFNLDDSKFYQLLKRKLKFTSEFHGEKFRVTINGVRYFTPLFLVLLMVEFMDLVFAVDSIPAIFGLTQNVYIVITANIFALMGLRQLYFLIGGLMTRLIYIGKGLSAILAFIGVKLVFHAFHAVGVHEIAGWHIPDITITQSLSVIVSCLIIATIASLVSTRNSEKNGKH